jgi:hypothetical protein
LRVVPRLVVVFGAGFLAAGFAAAFAVSDLVVSLGAVLLLVSVESRLITESPASGGASGWRKKTGSRMDTGTG